MKQKSIILEIRSGEGGNDAKLLVKEQFNIYIKSAKSKGYTFKLDEERDGFISI